MSNETEHFHDRLNRIQRGRRRRRGGMGFIVHPDGVVKPIGSPSSRLSFSFPLKGLLVAFVLAVAVKAYAMWAIGVDLYALEVATMIEGTSIERVVSGVLLPDALTLWVVDRYDEIAVFVQAGMAARAPVEG